MPGSPATTPRLAIPRFSNADPADFATDVNSVVDRVDAVVGRIVDVYANRPAANSTLDGLTFFATDKAMEWQCVAGAWVLVSVFAPLAASLPASPVDGQETCLLLDATNGIAAHLRYRAASTSSYKWECVGGSALFSRVDTASSAAAGNASYITAGAAPSITLPAGIGGDFDIEHGCAVLANPAATSYVYQSVAVGATAAVDADAIIGAAGNYETDSRIVRKTGVAAGATIAIRNRTDSASSGTWQNRWLSVRPIRVG